MALVTRSARAGRFGATARRLTQLDGDRDAAHPRPPRWSRSSTSRSATATRSPSTTSRSRSAHGEIFGILGPNGAGKTTTVECIGGLRKPDSGSISVLGLDVRAPRPRAARARRHPAADLGAAGQALRARGARAVRVVLPEPGRAGRAAAPARPRGEGATPATSTSPAARGSGCRSRSRWSGARSWRSSTS